MMLNALVVVATLLASTNGFTMTSPRFARSAQLAMSTVAAATDTTLAFVSTF